MKKISEMFLQWSAMLLLTVGLNAALPPNVAPFLMNEENSISEEGYLPNKVASPEFVRSITANWREVLENVPVIAPDSRTQSLIIVAAEFLPPPEYVKFLNVLCDLRAQGKLDRESLYSVWLARMVKSGFLSYNYDQPEVMSILVRLENQMTKDFPNELVESFASCKSGEAKSHLIAWRTHEKEPTPELFVGYDKSPYLRMTGGSVKQDIKLLATRPIEAVSSLASNNRTRWSMIVAVILMVGATVGFIAIILRFKRHGRR